MGFIAPILFGPALDFPLGQVRQVGVAGAVVSLSKGLRAYFYGISGAPLTYGFSAA